MCRLRKVFLLKICSFFSIGPKAMLRTLAQFHVPAVLCYAGGGGGGAGGWSAQLFRYLGLAARLTCPGADGAGGGGAAGERGLRKISFGS